MDWRILYNPLAVLGKPRGLLAALVIVIVLTATAWWGGVHLDGALDLHIGPERPSGLLITAESLIAWLSLAVFLFFASKILGGNSGFWAHLAGTGLARFPYIIAAVILSRPLLGEPMLEAVATINDEIVIRPEIFASPLMIVGLLMMVLLVAWSVVMLYMGFKEVVRIRGGRLIAAFVIGILSAEIVSKLLIAALIILPASLGRIDG